MLVSIFFSVVAVFAQDVPVGVVVAFKKGSAQELVPYLGDKVELIIQNDQSNFDRPGAQRMMTTFFLANKVTGFNVNHQGQRNESSFIVGTLNTSNGDFRINCFFKKIQNKYLIHQIRIDKTNE